MTSYASIDRIEGKFAVAEVEMLPHEESYPEDFAVKNTVMINIELHRILDVVGEVDEGDILVVEHDNKNIISIYYKDDEEKAKRIELFSKMWS